METTIFFPYCLCFAAFPTNKPDKDARHVIKVVSIAPKFMFHIHLTFLFSALFHFYKNVSQASWFYDQHNKHYYIFLHYKNLKTIEFCSSSLTFTSCILSRYLSSPSLFLSVLDSEVHNGRNEVLFVLHPLCLGWLIKYRRNSVKVSCINEAPR